MLGSVPASHIFVILQKREKGDYECPFVIVKTHKQKFELANKLKIGDSVYAEEINELGMILCTKLKKLEKEIDENKQYKLKN